MLEGIGKPIYQYVYREAAGVYWDEERNGFKSTELKPDWAVSDWVPHIILVTKMLGIDLRVDESTKWEDIPEEQVKRSLVLIKKELP